MNSKREKELEDAINDALKDEENLQHDNNDDPVLYLNSEDIEDIEDKEDLENDNNDDPVTFTEDSKD